MRSAEARTFRSLLGACLCAAVCLTVQCESDLPQGYSGGDLSQLPMAASASAASDYTMVPRYSWVKHWEYTGNRDISTASYPNIFLVKGDGSVLQWAKTDGAGGCPDCLCGPGCAKRVDVDGQTGDVYRVNDAGHVVRRPAGQAGWVVIWTPITDGPRYAIDVSADRGVVVAIFATSPSATSGKLYMYGSSGPGWSVWYDMSSGGQYGPYRTNASSVSLGVGNGGNGYAYFVANTNLYRMRPQSFATADESFGITGLSDVASVKYPYSDKVMVSTTTGRILVPSPANLDPDGYNEIMPGNPDWTDGAGRIALYDNGIPWMVTRVAKESRLFMAQDRGSTYPRLTSKKIIIISINGCEPGVEVGTAPINKTVREAAIEMGLRVEWSLPEYTRINGEDLFALYEMAPDAGTEVKAKIEAALSAAMQNNAAGKANTRLLLVGKSCGGVAAWFTMGQYWTSLFSGFDKVALVTVDGYGKSKNEEWYREQDHDFKLCSGHSLSGDCNTTWSTDANRLRLFGTYQREDDDMQGAGWSFDGVSSHNDNSPSAYCPNVQLCWWEQSTGHMGIETKPETREIIRNAVRYLLYDSE